MHPTISDHLVQPTEPTCTNPPGVTAWPEKTREAREPARPGTGAPAATVADFGSPDAGRADFPRSPTELSDD